MRQLLSKDEIFKYILKDEVGKKDPVTIHMTHLSNDMQMRYDRLVQEKLSKDPSRSERNMVLEDVSATIWKNHVKRIENYNDEDGKEVSPKMFYNNCSSKEILEVLNAMSDYSSLSTLQVKNSEGESD